MRPILPFLFCLTLIAVAAAQNNPVAGTQIPQTTPTVTGVLGGPRVPVFVTPKQMCDPNDLPDAMARAFRDSTGTVHLVAAATDLYQSLGPTLESAVHTCDAGYHSVNDGNPADYDDTVWIDSFYTFDGKKVAGLSHTEYHGWSFPGECHTQNIFLCEFDSDTFHISYDGGYHFSQSKAPANLVAGLPFKYAVDRGPMGYSVDTNIIEWNGWFYAMATDDGSWPLGCSGQTGPNRCLSQGGGAPIRTQDVFDPSSWRGWSGSDFSIQFVDPYTVPVKRPEEHVYTPVPYMTFVTSINIYQPANVVVATIFNGYDNEYGSEGLYLTTSTDLVNWTTPTLVITLAKLLEQEPTGNWQYAYFTLLDPAAPDMNFSMIGDQPYLYYVRLNNDSYLGRTLFRQPIQLSLNPAP
jgi:hypothetical protein